MSTRCRHSPKWTQREEIKKDRRRQEGGHSARLKDYQKRQALFISSVFDRNIILDLGCTGVCPYCAPEASIRKVLGVRISVWRRLHNSYFSHSFFPEERAFGVDPVIT